MNTRLAHAQSMRRKPHMSRRQTRRAMSGLMILLRMLAFCLALSAPFSPAQAQKNATETAMTHLTIENSVHDMITHPAFAAYGALLLPRPEDAKSALQLRDVGRLMPWHGHVQPKAIVAALNYMIDETARGQRVLYPFYPDGAKKEQTGLFFFRGKSGAPFALICPGGGFVYVGALHEGFPPAMVLRAKGYNAFVLQYRAGGEDRACADMARALSWIFAHAHELAVDTRGYSVWGGSAGARMAANLGSYGAKAFGGDDLPRPSAVIMAYTGHRRFTRNDPPTFAVVSADDPIAPASVMERRIQAMRQAGITAKIHIYRHAGHGFGTGEGTDAAGWMNDAIAFWEEQRKEHGNPPPALSR